MLALLGAAIAAGCSSGPTGPTPVKAPTLSRTRFLAFGDSLTAGEVTVPITVLPTSPSAGGLVPVTRLQVVPAASYPTQLNSLLVSRYTTQASSIAVVNAGVPGETALQGAARFVGTFSEAQPSVVLLFEGVNGLFGFGTDPSIDALQYMIIESRARGARVFLATMLPTKPGGRNTQSVPLLELMNTKLRALATAEGAVLVNLYDPMLPDAATLIGTDGLHPTEAGYRKMADLFMAAIQADLEVR